MSAHTAATTIQTTINPHPPNTKTRGMVLNTSLVVVIAPGKRPATFRTWKLSPAAPMVLQPTGCGRVGHRHNTLQASGQEPNGSWPLCFAALESCCCQSTCMRNCSERAHPRACGPAQLQGYRTLRVAGGRRSAPLAFRPASFGRRIGSKLGQALPPHLGLTPATRNVALHNSGCSWGLNPPVSRSARVM